jgi:hypothetical protein
MTMEWYDRSHDQNEELGLNDMIVEVSPHHLFPLTWLETDVHLPLSSVQGYEGEKEAQEASDAADLAAANAAKAA